MNSVKLFTVVALILIIGGCSIMDVKDAKLPSWSVQLEVPLTDQAVELSEMLEDSLIQKVPVGADGDSIFAYEDEIEIERVEVGDQLSIDDISESFTQSVDQSDIEIPGEQFSQSVDSVTVTGSTQNFSSSFSEIGVDPVAEQVVTEIGLIELDDIPFAATDPFLLNAIFPDIDDIPDGLTDSIPGFTITPMVQPFSFDDFNAAEFSAGQLEITIVNDMVIILGSPVVIQFQEIVGPDTLDIAGASVSFNSLIQPSQSATETMDLSGITLPGDILVKVSGSSVGSAGSPVMINQGARESSFVTQIGASNLTVTSADAQIPEQTFSEDGEIALADSENKVQSAKIRTGNLAIQIDNNLDVNATLDITLHSLRDEFDQPFNRQINLNANSPSTNPVYVVDNLFMVMPIDTQEVRYSYEVVTEGTAPGFATIQHTDDVVVDIDLYGATPVDQLVFSEIIGIIESQEVVENGDIAISSDSKVVSAEISSGLIEISVDNRINQPGFGNIPQLELVIPEIRSAAGDSLRLDPPENLNPGLTPISLDLAGYELIFPDTNTQVLTYETIVTTASGELGSFNLEDSILVSIEVGEIQFSAVTGHFNQDDLVQADIIQVDEATKIDQALIETGDLILTITNDVGIFADVDFRIDELTTAGAPLEHNFALSPDASPLVETISLAGRTMDLILPENYTDSNDNGQYDAGEPFDDTNGNSVWDSNQQINYESVISLPYEQEMTLAFGNHINVSVDIVNLTFSELTGYISQEDIVEDGIIALDDSTKVDEADIGNGMLVMSIFNNIGVAADVVFTIDEIVDSLGNPFSQQIQLLPETRGRSSEYSYDLSGYTIDLDLTAQEINYHSAISLPDDTPMTLLVDNDIVVVVDLTDMSFSQVTGIIDPVTVEIDSIEQEIESLPDELEGIEFDQVDMIMDFDSNIGLPVFLNLSIEASNADTTVESIIENWNISDSSSVTIPNAAALINITPERILASGSATVGEAGAAGSVASDQYIEGQFNIFAPLRLLLTEDSEIELDAEEVEKGDFPDELERLVVYARYDNQFEFGTQVEVYTASDTLHFEDDSPVAPNSLLTLDIVPASAGLDSIILEEEDIELFTNEDPLFIKPQVALVGRSDNQGNPLPSSFLSTDSMKILLYGSFQMLIDPDADEEED